MTSGSAADAWAELFQMLELLRSRWPSTAWEYDARLHCVSSAFPISAEPAARAVLAEITPSSWSATTLPEAPEEARALAERCGGLRAAQLLFWRGAPGQPGAFGLWWPWGDGTKISLRLGLHDVEPPTQHRPRLRAVFGLPA